MTELSDEKKDRLLELREGFLAARLDGRISDEVDELLGEMLEIIAEAKEHELAAARRQAADAAAGEMRERAARVADSEAIGWNSSGDRIASRIRALPLVSEPGEA